MTQPEKLTLTDFIAMHGKSLPNDVLLQLVVNLHDGPSHFSGHVLLWMLQRK